MMGMQNGVYYSCQSLEFVFHQDYFGSQYFIRFATSRRFLRLFWLTESPRNGKWDGGKEGAEAEEDRSAAAFNNARGLWASERASHEQIRSASCVCWRGHEMGDKAVHLITRNSNMSTGVTQTGCLVMWVSEWHKCTRKTWECSCCLDFEIT